MYLDCPLNPQNTFYTWSGVLLATAFKRALKIGLNGIYMVNFWQKWTIISSKKGLSKRKIIALFGFGKIGVSRPYGLPTRDYWQIIYVHILIGRPYSLPINTPLLRPDIEVSIMVFPLHQ